jgi:hypothetical protein
MVVISISHKVRCADFVSMAKAFTIGFPLLARNMRMTELIAIVHVEPAVIIKVSSSAFNAIAKTLPLGLGQILRRHIPTAVILSESGRGLSGY